ncbi:hypothetical protein FB451DRAFT_1552873 [Mycena latifolia]|nr:hypothetical protein FB451DRAFT_1552873 [Mycena latifolia]
MASGEDSSVFPPELEREIFETAAELYPETIYQPRLLLVAKRVYEWIERIKYRTVASIAFPPACPLRLLQLAIRSNLKPPDFFHNRVHHLFIYDFIPEGELQFILSACREIRFLTLVNCGGPSILPSLAVIKPRRLAVHLRELFRGAVELSHPAFAFVTHLLLFDPWDVHPFPWTNLAQLSALTHLAFTDLTTYAATKILCNCSDIKVLVDMCHFGYPLDRGQLPRMDDPRLVCVSLSYHDYTSDWVAGTMGEADFWVRAERFVVKKRRGEIEPSSRCWIEDEDGI